MGCAWRWRLVAGGLGVRLPLRTAVAHCYRSVFLNATLPGGVLGDVHRGVRHGRDVGDVGRGIRAVVWERSAGQVVQVAVALVVLCAFPSPVRSYLPAATALLVAGALGTVLLARALPRRGPSRWARALRTAEADVRGGLLARGTWLGVVLASAVVAGGYLATFLVAARTAGATAPLSRLVPLTVLALMAMLVPANIGGFGPREGVAAWAFGAAGLTAAQGVATAMVYGVLVLVASLPGETGLTAQRRYSGRGDVPLTSHGTAQARSAARRIARLGVDVAAVVSSPLSRCVETAQAVVAAAAEGPVRVDPDLIECDFGAWEGLTFAEVRRRWPAELDAWLAGADVAPPGGEPFSAVASRVSGVVARLPSEYPGRGVVLVSHVTPIKLILRDALAASDALLHRLYLDPGGLSIVDMYADGAVAVRTVNDTSHLR